MDKRQLEQLLALVLEARRCERRFAEVSRPESGATTSQEAQAWADYQDALDVLFEYVENRTPPAPPQPQQESEEVENDNHE